MAVLHIVSTPIGNRDDISLRALRVLGEVSVVAAEDTRHSGALLSHHGVRARRLVSFHARNQRLRLPQLLAALEAGEDVALVTDAGTPGLSDPGGELVRAAVAAGHRVEAVPGASAALAALVSSGLDPTRFHFHGFPPRTSGQLARWAGRALEDADTGVAFESGRRAAKTLAALAAHAPQRGAVVARELTKLHEEIWRGELSELATRAAAAPPRGEVTLVWAGTGSAGRREHRQPAR